MENYRTTIRQALRSLTVCFLLIGATAFAQDSSTDSLSAALPAEGNPPAPTVKTAKPVDEKISSADKAIFEKGESSSSEAAIDPKPDASVNRKPDAISSDQKAETQTRKAEIETVRELSVEPQSKPLLPEKRPAWVGASPDLSTSQHRLFVGSIPAIHAEDTDALLDDPMVAAVNGYIDEVVIKKFNVAQELQITPAYIRTHLLDQSADFMAELTTSSGPMYQKWVVLQITPNDRKEFMTMYRDWEQRRRLVGLGLGVLGLLGLTGIANLGFRRFSGSKQNVNKPKTPGQFAYVALEKPVASKRCCQAFSRKRYLAIFVATAVFMLFGLKHMRSRAIETAAPTPPHVSMQLEKLAPDSPRPRPPVRLHSPHVHP